jgi:polyhydroxyalkanoate synthesis regulator phasin
MSTPQFKQISDLRQALQNLGKQAAHPEQTTDPAEAGTKTDVGSDVDLMNEQQQGTQEPATLDKQDKKTGPAADVKVEAGDATSEVPGGKPFVENGKVATDVKGKIIELKERFAQEFNPGKQASTASTAPAQTAPAQTAAPTATDDEVEKAASALSPFMIQVLTGMLKSAAGREEIQGYLEELHGEDDARQMIKRACQDLETVELDILQKEAHALAQQEAAWTAQEDEARRQEIYAHLTKDASADEVKALNLSLEVVGQAHEKVAEHPFASELFKMGSATAEIYASILKTKQAGAMGAPMSEEEAMAMAAQQGAGVPGGEGEPSPEEIIAALEEMVASGEITEEEAQQMLQEMEAAGMLGGGEMKAASAPEIEAHIDACYDIVDQVLPLATA